MSTAEMLGCDESVTRRGEMGTLRRPRQWVMYAVVASDRHVDALSLSPVTGADLDTLAESLCTALPPNPCPFGTVYLLAVAAPDLNAGEGDAVEPSIEHALIAQVHEAGRPGTQAVGRWMPACSDVRFRTDWPWP